MSQTKKIQNALISVFYKDGLEPIIRELDAQGVTIYSTGGTQKFIEELGVKVVAVEDLTSYPSILGGRVKTLHPKVFGGILNRRDNESDRSQVAEFEIPNLDLVIVDLYPFEETLASGADEQSIIEKIDIGGISLIRAAAKNFADVAIVPSREDYAAFLEMLKKNDGGTTLEDRKYLASRAFHMSSHYDTAIHGWFEPEHTYLKNSYHNGRTLRYGENPHQRGWFYGDLDAMFDKLHGKELSYNNLLDVDAAVNIIEEFEDTTIAILKHNNACGLASRDSVKQAWLDALAGDPVSAFGGVIISNAEIDEDTAKEIDNIFYEVLIAPSFTDGAIEVLTQKKNRILLRQKPVERAGRLVRTALNGILVQDRDSAMEGPDQMTTVTKLAPTEVELRDMAFANKLVKHTKSNTIVLAKNGQLLASGTGQTSRVDALRQAIHKAQSFGFDLNGAVMASDAFFPFPDCVEIADNAGIHAVVQPGGSIRDKDSVEYCDAHGMAMVTTGVRHFKH